MPQDAEDAVDTLGGIALELITPSVTSRALSAINDTIINALKIENPHFKWYDLTRKGFMRIKLTSTTAESSWYLLDSVEEPETPGITQARTMTAEHSAVGGLRLKPAPHS